MKYKLVSTSGLRVSELCFGTMTFGGDADAATSRALYDRARVAGINFFDTANIYAGGSSEKLLGEFSQAERDQLVIASKVFFRTGPGPNDAGTSRKHLRISVENSLRSLRTDYLDILYLHAFDPTISVEEFLRTLSDLISNGKILHYALSNTSAWQAMKICGVADRLGYPRPICMQPMYNLVKRQAEVELLPLASAENLAVFPYSPIAGGLLTGKYVDAAPSAGRFIGNERYERRYADPLIPATVRSFLELARELGRTPASLAVAWVAGHPAVTAPIIGARSVSQMCDVLDGYSSLSEQERQRVSALSPSPAIATDRSEEAHGFTFS